MAGITSKYQVLFLLIVYYIVLVITTAVFSTGVFNVMTDQGGIWDAVNIIFGSLILNIPLIPVLLRAIISAPFWILLGYFIYLNIPMPLLNRAA